MSGDQELKAMGVVLAAMEPLAADERARVLAWLAQKLAIQAPAVQVLGKSPEQIVQNGQAFDHSTDTIATLMGARSGPDLIVAAAAHLYFAQGKPKFTRADLTAEMRSASGHFKETFVNNLSSYLVGLTKADRLRLVGQQTYSLSIKERQQLEARLANA